MLINYNFETADFSRGIENFSLDSVQYYINNRWATHSRCPLKQINNDVIKFNYRPSSDDSCDYFFRGVSWFLEIPALSGNRVGAYPLNGGFYIEGGVTKGMKELVKKGIDITEFLFSEQEEIRQAAKAAINPI